MLVEYNPNHPYCPWCGAKKDGKRICPKCKKTSREYFRIDREE